MGFWLEGREYALDWREENRLMSGGKRMGF